MNELQTRAIEIANKYNALCSQLVNIAKVVAQYEEDLELIEQHAFVNVSQEVDSLGKPVFTNEKAREAEKAKRLYANIGYVELKDVVRQHKHQAMDIEAEMKGISKILYAMDIATRTL
jgi:hypothetical protein